MQSFKICLKVPTHTSELDLRIFGGATFCVVVLLGFKSLAALSIASGVTF